MHWDYTDAEFNKQAASDPVWRLERMIIYGLGNQKLDRRLLERYLPQLNIPQNRRAFLELLLWNKPF